MLIVCPTCATTYQITLAALGASGRTVRCSHCKNSWFATAESVVEEPALVSVAGESQPGPGDFRVEITPPPPHDDFAGENAADDGAAMVVDAPPLAPQDAGAETIAKFDPGVPDGADSLAARRARHAETERKSRRGLLRRVFSLPVLIVGMLAILLGALNWRVAIVRHFPQTASLYAAIGLPVNLRGLFF